MTKWSNSLPWLQRKENLFLPIALHLVKELVLMRSRNFIKPRSISSSKARQPILSCLLTRFVEFGCQISLPLPLPLESNFRLTLIPSKQLQIFLLNFMGFKKDMLISLLCWSTSNEKTKFLPSMRNEVTLFWFILLTPPPWGGIQFHTRWTRLV